jgi:serine/threonine protein kinase
VPLFSDAANGANGLNYQQLQKFYALAGQQFFGESLAHLLNPDIFERFDFTGDGVLEFIQAFKSLKCELYTIFHDFGGETIKPIVFKTPEQMGYTMIKELARGGQGAAILADSVDYGKVVLKTYEKSNPNSGTIEEHIAEMEVLKELQKESFVMHAYDIFQDANCVYCVNELMEGGDLEGLREKAGNARIPLTQEYFRNIFKQTLLGLDHIHEHGLMHCDLKEPNVMIKTKDLRDPSVAIIDFGLAQVCAGPGLAGGTPGYIPPETNARNIWYPKGDIFALGVAFFQLLADKTPNEKLGKFGVFQEGFRTMDDIVMFTQTRPLPLHLISGKFPGAMSWLPSMCSKEKKPRPRALQLLENPFFKGEGSQPVQNGAAVPAYQAAQFVGGQVYAAPATQIVSGTTAAGTIVSSPYTQSTMRTMTQSMSLGSTSMGRLPTITSGQYFPQGAPQSPRVLNGGIAQTPQLVQQVAARSYYR